MTLTKKMAVGVLIMLLFVFIGTYFITMNNARNFFIQQLESNAQDTATSLGLSLSQSLINHDVPTMDSMVKAVFDRGYFSSIKVKDIKGKVIILKKQLPQESDIPKWFVNLIKWPSTEKSSLIMDEWMQAGVVLVASDPSYVYASLWRNAVEMVNAYLIFALVALVLSYCFLKYLLQPLKRVTAQALAISEHEFPVETKIPKTPELRQVTLAMNQMVTKVKSLFQDRLKQTESLRTQVYQDSLTGMSNRRYFLQHLALILGNEDEFIPGYVMMLVIDGLDELNQKQGYQQGDQLVLTVAKICKSYWKQSSVSTLARINGTTFALISHERDPLVFEKECKEFEQILSQGITDIKICKTYMGAASYFLHQPVSNLLSMVDQAVKKARETGVFYCQKEHDTYKYPQLISGDEIRNSLEQKKISLYAQAVTDGKNCFHKEVFVRIRNQEGEELGAGYFIPVAEKLGLAYPIDQYVLNELTVMDIATHTHFALNISEDTLANKVNSTGYLRQLKDTPAAVLRNLSLEINEAHVLSHFSSSKFFIKQAKKLGVTVGID